MDEFGVKIQDKPLTIYELIDYAATRAHGHYTSLYDEFIDYVNNCSEFDLKI